MKFGPELRRRVQAAHERKRLIAEAGEGYLHMSGEYRQPSHPGEIIPAHPEVDKLYGTEVELYGTLLQLDQINRHQKLDRPTIMLDFGGMAGLSMVRIAAQPEIISRIERGEVMMVVSNLGFDMKAEFAKNPAQRLEFLTVEQAFYVSALRYLVHYVSGDASALLRSTITTPDGKSIPLRGNVDLVHEHLALAHGQKNDLDIPRLGKLVSPTGELWLGTEPDRLAEPYNPNLPTDPALALARQQAHQLGLANLAELNLQPKPSSQDFSYQVFRHAN